VEQLGYPFAKNVDGRFFLEKNYFIVSKLGLKIWLNGCVIRLYFKNYVIVCSSGYYWYALTFFVGYAGIFEYTQLNRKKNSPITLNINNLSHNIKYESIFKNKINTQELIFGFKYFNLKSLYWEFISENLNKI